MHVLPHAIVVIVPGALMHVAGRHHQLPVWRERVRPPMAGATQPHLARHELGVRYQVVLLHHDPVMWDVQLYVLPRGRRVIEADVHGLVVRALLRFQHIFVVNEYFWHGLGLHDTPDARL
jgi:hypothetical protein